MKSNARNVILTALAAALVATPALAADSHATHAKPVVKKVVQTKPAAKAAKKDVYVCPMHPEVTSAKPADCPKCGMHLEKKTK